MCGSANEVKICTADGKQSTFCSLWPYRFGKRPAGSKKRIFTDEQRQKMSENMKKIQKDQKAASEAI